MQKSTSIPGGYLRPVPFVHDHDLESLSVDVVSFYALVRQFMSTKLLRSE